MTPSHRNAVYSDAATSTNDLSSLNGIQYSLDQTLSRMCRLVMITEEAADRLAGGSGRSAAPDGPKPVPAGMVDSFAEIARNLDCMVERFGMEIQRIRGSLGMSPGTDPR